MAYNAMFGLHQQISQTYLLVNSYYSAICQIYLFTVPCRHVVGASAAAAVLFPNLWPASNPNRNQFKPVAFYRASQNRPPFFHPRGGLLNPSIHPGRPSPLTFPGRLTGQRHPRPLANGVRLSNRRAPRAVAVSRDVTAPPDAVPHKNGPPTHPPPNSPSPPPVSAPPKPPESNPSEFDLGISAPRPRKFLGSEAGRRLRSAAGVSLQVFRLDFGRRVFDCGDGVVSGVVLVLPLQPLREGVSGHRRLPGVRRRLPGAVPAAAAAGRRRERPARDYEPGHRAPGRIAVRVRALLRRRCGRRAAAAARRRPAPPHGVRLPPPAGPVLAGGGGAAAPGVEGCGGLHALSDDCRRRGSLRGVPGGL